MTEAELKARLMVAMEAEGKSRAPGYEFIHTNNVLLVDEKGVVQGKWLSTDEAEFDSLRRELKKQLGIEIAVIVSDSFGRPWREGLTEVAIGVAGMRPLVDYRGRRDPHGYSLHATVDAVADELACAAGLVCGKLAGTPACIIRGYSYCRENRRGSGGAREMIRSAKNDLFR